MLIRMRAFRVMQDAGRERPLNVDQVYDLPDVVACAFIATGVAISEQQPHDMREVASLNGAPEVAALRVKGRRR